MVVECPSCGQLVKGYPGQSGPCPKCGQRFSFPEENKNAGAFVTCPHCGQMQLLQSDGKCIKCKSTIYVYDRSLGKRALGPLYLCPSCGHIQTGESEHCENCKSDMRKKGWLSKLFAIAFGLFSLSYVFNFIMYLHSAFTETGYVSRIDIYSLREHLGPIIIFLILFIISLKAATSPPKKRIKNVKKSYPFCNIDGIQGISFESSGTMEFLEDGQQIRFSIGNNFSRSLEFRQVIGISYGNYNYQERKSVVGGVAVGNVYLHGSPVSQKTKPFFQIKYRPNSALEPDKIIRVIFNDWTNMQDLEFLIAWIGLKMDSSYIVDAHDNL